MRDRGYRSGWSAPLDLTTRPKGALFGLGSVTGPCVRCVMTTLAQGDLPRDPGILRTAAQHNKVSVGVYATVERGGTIRRGDAVRVE